MMLQADCCRCCQRCQLMPRVATQSIVLKGDNWMIMVPQKLTEVSCPNCRRGSIVTVSRFRLTARTCRTRRRTFISCAGHQHQLLTLDIEVHRMSMKPMKLICPLSRNHFRPNVNVTMPGRANENGDTHARQSAGMPWRHHRGETALPAACPRVHSQCASLGSSFRFAQ